MSHRLLASSFVPAVLLLAVLSAPDNAHSEGEGADLVTVEASRAMYAAGDAVELTVNNKRAASVWIPGCAAAQIERFESERYVPVPPDACVSEGVAVEVAPGTHVLRLTASPEQIGQILRAGVSYGWGCETGRELSQARCADFATAHTASFRITKRGTK